MTNATERLRAMLDERGVEWRKAPHYSGESQDNETIFEGNGIEWYTNDHMNGRLGLRALRYEVTPEQAVEATLGKGMCRDKNGRNRRIGFECTACGVMCSDCDMLDMSEGFTHFRYCPSCGRKVVDA